MISFDGFGLNEAIVRAIAAETQSCCTQALFSARELSGQVLESRGRPMQRNHFHRR